MEMKGNTLTIVLLVVGLIAGAGYMLAPKGSTTSEDGVNTVTVETLPLEGKTIQIGYICPTTATLETSMPLVKEIQ